MESSDFIAQLLKQSLTIPDPQPSLTLEALVDSLAELAKTQRHNGQQFLLSDFLEERVRQTLTPGERKQLGKIFRKKLEGSGIAKFSHRRSDNHAVYTRTA